MIGLINKILANNSRVFVAISVMVLFAYGNILFGDFVFDDNIFIENNIEIRSPANIESIYSTSTTAGSGLSGDNFYRPNQQFVYMLLYNFFGLNPFFFHLIPVLIHILNACLVFFLFLRLNFSREASFLSASIFALHPIMTQAVSYVSGLSELLSALSFFLGIFVFLRLLDSQNRRDYTKFVLLGSGLFAVGLMSKENQVVLIPIISTILLVKWREGVALDSKKPIFYIGVLLSIFLFCLYLRLEYLNFTGVLGLSAEINPYTENIFLRISTFVHILPEYFKMLLFPWHLNYEKPYEAFVGYWSPQSLTGVLIVVMAVFGVVYGFIKKNFHYLIAPIWFFCTLAPVSGIVPVNSMYLEHWLYLPMVGVLVLIFSFYDNLSKNLRKKVLIFVFILLFLFSLRVIARNIEWGDPIRFYENELRYTDSSARIYNNFAMELAEKGDCQRAIENYDQAIKIADVYPQTHHNKGNCQNELGDVNGAGNSFIKALMIEPNFSYSLNALYLLMSGLEDDRAPLFLNLIKKNQSGLEIQREEIINALK